MGDDTDKTESGETDLDTPSSETPEATDAPQVDENTENTSDQDENSDESNTETSDMSAESTEDNTDDKVDMIIDTLEDETPEISPVEPDDLAPKRGRVFRTFATLSLITALVGGGVGGMKLQQMLDARNSTTGPSDYETQLAALQSENEDLKSQMTALQAPADPSLELPALEDSSENLETEMAEAEVMAEADTSEDEVEVEVSDTETSTYNDETEAVEAMADTSDEIASEADEGADIEAMAMDIESLPTFPKKTVRDALYTQSISHLTGWQRRLAENVRLRSTAEKDTVDNILDAIASEDMETALSLTQSLPTSAQDAAQDWISAVQTTLTSEDTTEISQESPQ